MPLTSLPNLLTLSRILVVPIVVATFYVPGDYARWFACALFSAAGVTDWRSIWLIPMAGFTVVLAGFLLGFRAQRRPLEPAVMPEK